MQIKILDHELYTVADLAPATYGAAGIDLKLARDARSALEMSRAGNVWPYHDLIGTGVEVAIPYGWLGLLVPRSSSGHKLGFKLGNTIGIIDADYRGEVKVSVAAGDYNKLVRGATVAQLVLVPAYDYRSIQLVDELPLTVRGDGGFGSTDDSRALVVDDLVTLQDVAAPLPLAAYLIPPEPEVAPEEELVVEPDEAVFKCHHCLWEGSAYELVAEHEDYLCPNCMVKLA